MLTINSGFWHVESVFLVTIFAKSGKLATCDFIGSCDHCILQVMVPVVDLWDGESPSNLNGTSSCGTVQQVRYLQYPRDEYCAFFEHRAVFYLPSKQDIYNLEAFRMI